jgi:hypothetical protein
MKQKDTYQGIKYNKKGWILVIHPLKCNKIGLPPPDGQSGKKNKKGLASVILAPIRLKVNW